MKINKFIKYGLLIIVLFSLVACSGKTEGKGDPVDSPQDNTVVEPQSLEMVYSLLGKEYRLPTSYKTLKEDGWILEDNPTFILESEEFIKNRFVRNGSHILELNFYNPSDEAQKIEDSLVSSVAAENRTFGNDVASDILVHSLIDFESDIDQIVEKLGDYELEESAQFKTYTFQHDSLSKTEIKIEQDTESMRWIIIENFKTD